jgi:dihydrofolate synthase/folylpolyglutamate synthase
MIYKETLRYLYRLLPMFQRIGEAAYKANLDNTIALDKYFGHPHQNYKTIHVAGTNGKGSVSHTLASILAKAGYKTGLYTSPHLKDFRERIKINGEKISEQKVIDFVENHKSFFEPLKPSFFELTVAMAFDFFSSENVDVAVIETGLGGRLDSTNIIIPVLSVITNISLDHTHLLGYTLEKIAMEKAGIMKKGIPVVIAESQKVSKDVFIQKAKELSCPIYFADDNYVVDNNITREPGSQTMQIYSKDQLVFSDLKTDLPGIYQKKNTVGILQAVDLLQKNGFKIDSEAIYKGFEFVAQSTGLNGRWQTLKEKPLTICDIAHNEAGINEILEQLKIMKFNNLHMVFGVVADKDIDKILEMLPVNAIYYFCKAPIPRALDEIKLQQKASLFGLQGKSYSSVKLALSKALEKAQEDDLVFIGGSAFVVAEVV